MLRGVGCVAIEELSGFTQRARVVIELVVPRPGQAGVAERGLRRDMMEAQVADTQLLGMGPNIFRRFVLPTRHTSRGDGQRTVCPDCTVQTSAAASRGIPTRTTIGARPIPWSSLGLTRGTKLTHTGFRPCHSRNAQTGPIAHGPCLVRICALSAGLTRAPGVETTANGF